MRTFKTRDAAEEFIAANPQITLTTQAAGVCRTAFENEYCVAIYDVLSVSPFRIEFNRYLK